MLLLYFAEQILQLMRKCQMDLESQSIKTLLRFLLYTSYHAEHCWKLIKRVKKDGNVDVSHMELVAMSYAINRKIPDSCKFLAVNKASHASPNYLHVFPNTLHMVS